MKKTVDSLSRLFFVCWVMRLEGKDRCEVCAVLGHRSIEHPTRQPRRGSLGWWRSFHPSNFIGKMDGWTTLFFSW